MGEPHAFDDDCTVTASVRAAIPVEVQVVDCSGNRLKSPETAAARLVAGPALVSQQKDRGDIPVRKVAPVRVVSPAAREGGQDPWGPPSRRDVPR